MRYKVEAVVEVDGVEETVVAKVDGRDVREWEARHDKSFMSSELSYTALTELAYFSARRAGLYAGEFGQWMADCIGVKEVSDEQEVAADARPTKRGRGGGSARR